MKRVHFVKTVIFILIFAILLWYATDILRAKWLDSTSTTLVQDQMSDPKKDTVDVLILGNSQLVWGISAMRMLDQYGIAAHSCATGGQPTLLTCYYLDEMEKTQDIKTIIYDVSALYEDDSEVRFHQTLDSAKFTWNKLKVILERWKNKEVRDSTLEYLFPIIKYHTRWDSLREKDYAYRSMEQEVFKGNIMTGSTVRDLEYDKVCVDQDEIDPSVKMVENEEKYFRRFVEQCQEKGIKLVIIKTPKSSWNKSKMLGVEQLVQEYGLEYMDFNTSEMMKKLNLDITMDFKDKDHLNVRGAEKLTDYLAEYLLETDTYEDGRKTAAYSKEEMERFHRDWEDKYLETSWDLQEYCSLAQNERYEVLISSSGDISAYWTKEAQAALEQLGVTIDMSMLAEQNYAGYVANGKAVYELLAPEAISYSGSLKDQTAFTVVGDRGLAAKKAAAVIGDNKVEYRVKGLNIAVYDSQNHKLVDNITLYGDEESGSLSIYRKYKE